MSVAYWHIIHHDVLMEWTDDIEERIAYVKRHKPAHEVETRLRLMQPVRGALPDAVVEARRASVEARRASDEARRASDEAWQAYDEAWRAYDEAWRAHMPEIEALHAIECPDCPWDGKTIFPEEVTQ